MRSAHFKRSTSKNYHLSNYRNHFLILLYQTLYLILLINENSA